MYYRAGYAPEHYYNSGWAARLKLERSRAVKCPSIGWQLAGAKKVQQDLASTDVMGRYLEADAAERVASMFADMFGFEEGKEKESEGLALALASPDDFVLKP